MTACLRCVCFPPTREDHPISVLKRLFSMNLNPNRQKVLELVVPPYAVDIRRSVS